MNEVVVFEQPVLAKGVAIEQMLDGFLGSLDVKPASKETYRKNISRFICYYVSRNIQQPSRLDILNYKNYLLDAGYTSSTVSGYIIAVRKLFEWLESEKIYPNIAKSIKGARRAKGFRKDVLSVEQVKKVFKKINRKTLNGKRDFAILNLLVRTGLRTVELQRATVADLRNEGGEQVLYIQGKGRDAKDDFVLLTEQTFLPIKEYIRARATARDGEPLFASHSNKNFGSQLTVRSVRRVVKRAFLLAGINDARVTAHSLRHTAITLCLLGGATLQEAQRMARHTDINTTLIYAQNINRVANAPERKIDLMLI